MIYFLHAWVDQGDEVHVHAVNKKSNLYTEMRQ